jgi:hypothetical protein
MMSETRVKMEVLQDMRAKVYTMARDSKYNYDEKMAIHAVAIEIGKFINEIIDNS